VAAILITRAPALAGELLTDAGELKDYMNVQKNGRDINFLRIWTQYVKKTISLRSFLLREAGSNEMDEMRGHVVPGFRLPGQNSVSDIN
jgi:hypothetical protein